MSAALACRRPPLGRSGGHMRAAAILDGAGPMRLISGVTHDCHPSYGLWQKRSGPARSAERRLSGRHEYEHISPTTPLNGANRLVQTADHVRG